MRSAKNPTLVMLVTALTAVPVGVMAAIYLEEYAPKNWFTGIKTNPVQNASFSVFPNPATEYVTVRFEGLTDGPLEVSLYDVIGQRVKTAQFSREIGQTDYQLNLSDVAQGLYIIRLTGKQQGVEFERHDRLNVIY